MTVNHERYEPCPVMWVLCVRGVAMSEESADVLREIQEWYSVAHEDDYDGWCA